MNLSLEHSISFFYFVLSTKWHLPLHLHLIGLPTSSLPHPPLTLTQVYPDYNAPSMDELAWRQRVSALYDQYDVQYDKAAFLQSGFSSTQVPLRTHPGKDAHPPPTPTPPLLQA